MKTKNKEYRKKGFIEKSISKHGNNYDYSKVEHINSKTKVYIICPIHGEFYQEPSAHIRGYNCPKCSRHRQGRRTMDSNTFIKKSKEIFGDRYTYEKTEYINSDNKICITCPEHGDLYILPFNHITSKQGCPRCVGNQRLTNEEFVEKSKQIHNDSYDYSQVKYINNHSKLKIICPVHGEFWQMTLNHMKGCGCPKCVKRSSKEEMRINDFLSKYITTETTVRNIIHPYELDIYIPTKKVGIEYDGLYWHNNKNVNNSYHLMKTELCEKHNIKLIHIFEDEWDNHSDIVKSRLKDVLNIKMDNNISISDCEVKDTCTILTFLRENSLYPPIASHYYYGLYNNEKLVSIMSFNNTEINGLYELSQFCVIKNTTINGTSKTLFQSFIKERNPNKIIYYDDRRWSNYKLIFDLQLNKISDTHPSCFYVKCYIREHSKEHINIDDKTHKIFDCGKSVYEWKNNK